MKTISWNHKIGCALVIGTLIGHSQTARAGWTGSMNGTGFGKAKVNVTSSTSKSNSIATPNMQNPSAAMTNTVGYAYGTNLPSGASKLTTARIKGLAGYVWTANTMGTNGDKTDQSELQGYVTPSSPASTTSLEILGFTTNACPYDTNLLQYTFSWHWIGSDPGTAQKLKWIEYDGDLPTNFDGDVGSLPDAIFVDSYQVTANGCGGDSAIAGRARSNGESECPTNFDEIITYSICATNDISKIYLVTEGVAVSCTPFIVVQNTNDSGPGSLRRALIDICPDGTITFDPSLAGQTIVLTSGELDISKGVTILGLGANLLSIDGNGNGGVFYNGAGFTPNPTVTITGLTITNGWDNYGGGIYNDGSSILSVSNCTICGNFADGGAGGGIYNAYYSTLNAINCTFSGNSSDVGGAIENNNGTLYAANCTFSQNSAVNGGAISTEGYFYYTADSIIVNCTFSGNSASSGGVIYGNADIFYDYGYAIYDYPGIATIEMVNTILDDGGATGGNVYMTNNAIFISLGNNLSSDNCNGFLTGTNDLPNTDPLLGPLQDNGGPTFTCALPTNSPAIDAGTNQFALDQNGDPLTTDQRSGFFPRVVNGTVDIGAFELQSACSQPPIIVCSPPVIVEFQNETGAAVFYSVAATGVCSSASLTVMPPSGSWFGIGVSIVHALAVDDFGNSNRCFFTVTVLGAMGVKSNVLAQLIALRATNAFSQPFAGKFDDAILHLQNSLNPAYWIDQTHLQPKGGSTAMNEEKLTVTDLDFIAKSKQCPVNPAIVQDFINRIIKCDRLLAIISIQDAAVWGLNPKKVAEDLDTVAKGDDMAAKGNYSSAIEQYRNAWRHALQLHLQVSVTANGSAHLVFVGNNSKSYLIQMSSDSVHWQTLGTYKADSEGNIQITDTNAWKYPFQLYRAVEQ